jgi:glutathione S-transferase
MSYTVHGAGISPFVRKVRAFLMEKGLEYAHDPVIPFNPPPTFRKLSPLGKIPAFSDGDKTLADSSIICAYLERRNPTPPLYPKDDYLYARALWFEEYSDGGLMNVIGPGIFGPLVIQPALRGVAPDHERAKKAMEEELPPLLTYLEGELGEQSFFVGNALSIGDLAIAAIFVNLMLAGGSIDKVRWPKLAAWVERMHARPSFKTLIEEDHKNMAALRRPRG